jgi:hypothetical protein
MGRLQARVASGRAAPGRERRERPTTRSTTAFAAPTVRSSLPPRALRRKALLLLGVASVGLAGAGAPPQRVAEAGLKSAFLYKFTLFTDWNGALGSPDAPISICVMGRDDIADYVQEVVQNRTAHGRRIAVRRPNDSAEAEGCHVLFIGWSDPTLVDRALARLADRPILTVGELEGFAERGGMINIVKRDHRLRLEINPRAVERSGLRLSSQLLKLAKLVDGEGGS